LYKRFKYNTFYFLFHLKIGESDDGNDTPQLYVAAMRFSNAPQAIRPTLPVGPASLSTPMHYATLKTRLNWKREERQVYKALLFDLDGTLLPMDLDVFMKAYFHGVTRKFAHLLRPDKLISDILHGTAVMVKNCDRSRTNREVFWSDFATRVGSPAEVLEPMFDEFYDREFASLKQVTGPNPLARPLMEGLFRKGFRVAIATNPIFPERAIRERLRWLEIDDLPFDLVTTYETMHFCKPNPEYYIEVLELLGAAPGECLMIGNDVEEDLVAGNLGIKTFLVEDWLQNTKNLPIKADHRGSFADLAAYLDNLCVPVSNNRLTSSTNR
jgi:FMN phosphatase YigB (HAD superfamily)